MENRLFNIPVSKTPPVAPPSASPLPPAGDESEQKETTIGVISAQQSAITFAGAPAAVTIVWKVLGAVESSLSSSKLLAVALSIFVGMLIYWQTAPTDGSFKDKITGFIFALINSFAIAAATLGIDTTTAG